LSARPVTPITVVVKTVHPGPLGGAIFFGQDAGGNRHRFIASFNSIFRAPLEGEVWTLEGAVKQHPRYGPQIHVETARLERPSGRLIVDYLVRHPGFACVGVGRKKAESLWNRFGEDLYTALSEGDVAVLAAVLTDETARKLVEAWRKTSADAEVVRFLAHYGFDVRLANKVRRVWGEESIQKLQENPYRMMAFADFEKVDAMSRSLGVEGDDPRRQMAAVEGYLYRRLDVKHTLTPEEDAIQGVLALLKSRDRADAQSAIGRAVMEGAVTSSQGGYQPLGAAVMERTIADRFRLMVSGSTGKQRNLFSDSLGAVIADAVRKFEREHGVTLNAEQLAGVRMGVSHPLSVLTGGAGVGKTTVLKVIHEVSERTRSSVRQMALSGRAAQRMREATGREASTIAKFLREADEGKIDPRGDPLVIIDESSMLDLPLTFNLIRALPESARLLLVGDPYQLPPIGFGLVFHVLAGSPLVPRVELTQVHRQAESSGVPQIAYDLRRGILPDLPTFEGIAPGVTFTDARGEEMIDLLERVTEKLRGLEDVQILGVTKRGVCGVKNINSIFHAMHAEAKGRAVGQELVEGDPVIYLANDYGKELWNGSLGRVEAVSHDPSNGGKAARFLSCRFEGVRHEIGEEDLVNIDLAYAITVHKAQGSQFRRVVMPVVRSRLLDRSLLYTALTRGIEQIIFIGDREVFCRAIKELPTSQNRSVGFSL
jgi:exodeoxyribonuclease V alpha subunit